MGPWTSTVEHLVSKNYNFLVLLFWCCNIKILQKLNFCGMWLRTVTSRSLRIKLIFPSTLWHRSSGLTTFEGQDTNLVWFS